MNDERAKAAECLTVAGRITRHEAEALSLEIRRLAKRYGVEIRALTVEREDEIVSPKRGKLRFDPA